jgi:hypothetical protein
MQEDGIDQFHSLHLSSLPAYDAEGRATTCHDELYPACAIGPQFPG